jgi:hypothetical protein
MRTPPAAAAQPPCPWWHQRWTSPARSRHHQAAMALRVHGAGHTRCETPQQSPDTLARHFLGAVLLIAKVAMHRTTHDRGPLGHGADGHG